MLELDHIAVLGETLEEAAGHVEAALGLPMQPGGKHARYGTHNRLIGLQDNLYLEAIAVDPGAPPPPDARWFGLDTFSGPARLNKWICRVPDLAAALDALPMAGRAVHLARGTLEWAMAVPENGQLPFDGVFPALIEWKSPVPPGSSLPASAWRLAELVIEHPEAESLQSCLDPHLSDPRIRFATARMPALSATVSDAGGRSRVLQ